MHFHINNKLVVIIIKANQTKYENKLYDHINNIMLRYVQLKQNQPGTFFTN